MNTCTAQKQKKTSINNYSENTNCKHLRYYLPPVRMAVVKKTKDKHWQWHGERGPL